VGCIVPRCIRHARALRADPPRAPVRLERLGAHHSWTTDDGDAALVAARAALTSRRYRVIEGSDADGRRWLSAERGRHRETGNVSFHLAVLAVLVGMALTSLLGFKATTLVVVGNGFANTVTQYDSYSAGRLVSASRLTPFSLTLDSFTVRFETGPQQFGAAREFDAAVTVVPRPGAAPVHDHLLVNHPLHIGNEEVHLIGHGYAPVFTVTDGAGRTAYSGPVAFLPQDGNFSSTGVLKLPDAKPDQLALQGLFLPTAVLDPTKGPVSVFPDAGNPMVYLTAYTGNLGLDDGRPSSVYALDTARLTQLSANGEPFRVALRPGESARLPDGAGTVRLDGYQRWVNLQVSSRPGTMVVFAGAAVALFGISVSLFVGRRRTFVGVRDVAGRTVVTLAGLDQRAGAERSPEGLVDDLAAVAAAAGKPERVDRELESRT
jgi:cytochrome c biogenesis protein